MVFVYLYIMTYKHTAIGVFDFSPGLNILVFNAAEVFM